MPLTARAEITPSPVGEAETQPLSERKMIMEKLLLSPIEAADQLGIGRSKIYELMRLGDLRSVKIGGSRRITRAALAEFVAGLEAMAS